MQLKQEQWFGLLFVLALHGVALYELWSYRIIPTPDEAFTMMVELINPPTQEQPKPPEPLKPPPPKPIEPLPERQQLVVETPIVLPDEPTIYQPPSPPPAPVIEAPPLPPQPVMLSNDLAVSCSERMPPEYPLLSKRRNEQGRVVLRVELDTEGRVDKAVVKNTSGSPRLDEAALAAVKMWRCKPAMRDGAAVRAVALQPFNFSLVEN